MIRALIFVVAGLAFFAQGAFAQTCSATLTWQPPTENTDGTPLTDLAGFRVYWGLAVDDLSNSVTLENASLTSYIVDDLGAAQWFFAVTAHKAQGLESMLSNLATKTTVGCIALADPRPPGAVTVQPDGPFTVYDFVPQTNRAVMLPVGTVPAGTICIATQAIVASGDLFFAVPRELVAWAGNVEPAVVYARCE
jgi:hypothetical protein